MAYYKNPTTGEIQLIENPNLNPDLIAGRTQVTSTGEPITSTDLAPVQVPQIPPQSQDTNNYNADIAGGNAGLASNQPNLTPPDTAQTDLTALFDKYITSQQKPPSVEDLSKSLYETPEFQAKEQDVLTQQGTLKTAQGKLAGINAQLAALTAEQQAIPIRLQKEAEGRGITAGGLAPIETAQLRDLALRALPLQAQAYGAQAEVAAAQGNTELAQQTLKLAQDRLDRVFQIKTKDAENEYAYRTKIIDAVFQFATDQQKTKLVAQQKKADQDFQIFMDNKNNAQELSERFILNNQLDLAARVAQLNPSSPTFQKDLLNLQSQFKIQPQQLHSEITGGFEVLRDSTGKIISTRILPQPSGAPISEPIISSDGKELVFGTPEYVIQKLQNTAKSKTKLVASEREQLGKFANVVALTDNLMTSLNKTINDPLLGYLKSLNPYDFDARAVNAQVTALVPSVARALYGEVGVLTDTDIERYLKTLPNIRSTDEQNQFIALMTLTNAKRAYEQTLLNSANAGVNVSGFVDSYKDIVNKVDTLEKELKIGDVQITGEDEAIFDAVVQTAPQKQGYFSKLWNSLMGR